MKRKEKESIQQMQAAELTKLLVETQKKISELNLKRYSEAPKNSRERKMLRKKVARIKTQMRITQLGEHV